MPKNIVSINVNQGDLLNIDDLNDYIEELQRRLTTLEVLKEISKEHITNTINELKLNNINFTLSNIETIENGLDNGTIQPILFLGQDENYTYQLIIDIEFEDETEVTTIESLMNDDPYLTTTINAYRMSNNSDEVYAFDFENKTWAKYSYEEMTGFTNKQIDWITKPQNDEEAAKGRLISLYVALYGPLSNNQFKKLINTNKEIFSLFTRFVNLLDVEVLDESTIGLVSPSFAGSIITYENGEYIISSYVYGLRVDDILRTNNIMELYIFMNDFYKQNYGFDVMAVVPLSKTTCSIIRNNGLVATQKIKSEPGNINLTKKEKTVQDNFIEKLKSVDGWEE